MPELEFADGTFDIGDWEKLGGDWREKLDAQRRRLREGFDTRHYEREDLLWYRRAYLEYFTFAWDSQLYDRNTGQYRIEGLIDRGIEDFGGFDFILLWHGYPRLGVDERNQFDILRDMPGGLRGLRNLVDRAHARGVKVFLPYMPWDRETRREPKSDEETLADIVGELDLDGLVLDTMNAASPELREAVDRAKPGVVFSPEYYPPTRELAEICTGSDLAYGRRLNTIPHDWWGSNFQNLENLSRKVLVIQWVEPRYSVRGNMGHNPAYQFQCPTIANDFFHGMGHQILDNIFGWWTPYSLEAQYLLRRCMRLLRAHHRAFMDPDWQPYVQTLKPGVFAHRWQDGDKILYTLFNNRGAPVEGPVLEIPVGKGLRCFDAWNGGELGVGGKAGRLKVSIKLAALSCGCLLIQPESWDPPVSANLKPPAAEEMISRTDVRLSRPEDHLPKPVAPCAPLSLPSVAKAADDAAPHDIAPKGMVLVPAGEFVMKVHCDLTAPEGGCYSHPDRKGHPDRLCRIPGFAIDVTEVTNGQFREFLRECRYSPVCKVNFLKAWVKPEGAGGHPETTEPWTWEIPDGLQNHPVVYVDLEDARAFACWAGKRLPTEEEWQYAAQGTDGRTWPWGDSFESGRCNGPDGTQGWNKSIKGSGGATTEVDAYPEGAGPFGSLDMSGNVWEWTESERDDGHTRYAILKGGSCFRAGGTRWYTPGGAQPANRHCKMLLLWPGLDRCSTLGFRCVKDMAHERKS